jgi:hypothetical protein
MIVFSCISKICFTLKTLRVLSSFCIVEINLD